MQKTWFLVFLSLCLVSFFLTSIHETNLYLRSEIIVPTNNLSIQLALRDSWDSYQPDPITAVTKNSRFNVTIWTAICDTRNLDQGAKALIIYALSSVRSFGLNGNMFTCAAFDEKGVTLGHVRETRFYSYLLGFMLICPFNPQFECPKSAAIRIGNENESPKVPVELQDPPIQNSRTNKLAICLPPVTNYSIIQLSLERVVEFFEYYRLFGNTTIYQPVLSLNRHPLYPPEHLTKVWKYYQKIGVLKLYKVIAHPTIDRFRMFKEQTVSFFSRVDYDPPL